MALTPISEFKFTKDWTKPADFPTFEDDETTVRADMQYQPNELRSYLNNVITDFINNTLIPVVDSLVTGTVSPDSVYTDAIQNEAVTKAKLAAGSVGTEQLEDGCVGSDQLSDGGVVYGKLGAAAVGNTNIAQDAVRSTHIQKLAVTLEKLATDVTAVALGGAAAAHTHGADDVTSGIFADARIPSLDAGKITTGTFAAARIPGLDTSKITSGTFGASRLADDIPYTKFGLVANQVRTVTVGTGDPSGGSDGDIYLQYEA